MMTFFLMLMFYDVVKEVLKSMKIKICPYLDHMKKANAGEVHHTCLIPMKKTDR